MDSSDVAADRRAEESAPRDPTRLGAEEIAERTGYANGGAGAAARAGVSYDVSGARGGVFGLLSSPEPATPFDGGQTMSHVASDPELSSFFASELQDADSAFFKELSDAVFYDERQPFDLSYPDRPRAQLDAVWGQLRRELPTAPPGTGRPEPQAPLSSDPARARQVLEASPGFASLDAAKQDQLRALIGGQTDLAAAARRAFAGLVDDSSFTSASPEQQAQQLLGLQKSLGGFPLIVQPEAREPAPYTVTEIPRSELETDREPVLQERAYRVEAHGHSVEVLVPRDPGDAQVPGAEAVAEAIARMPAEAAQNLERVTVRKGSNPFDGVMGWLYGVEGLEAAMRHDGGGVVQVYECAPNDPETMAVLLTHEAGHAEHGEHFGFLRGSWRGWNEAMAEDGLAASKYATAHKTEDFAESFALYTTSQGRPEHDELRAILPARFALLDRLLAED